MAAVVDIWPEGRALLTALSPAMVALMDELSQTMFCAKDVTGRYVAVNATFVARTNERSRRAVIGHRAAELFVPQLAERYEDQDAEVLRTGRALRGELESIRRPGGASGWYLTAKLPVRDVAGSIVGLVSVSQDLRAGEADDDTMAALTRLIATVEADLGGRWTTARLAECAGWSVAALDRRVRRVYGITPRQLVLRARTDRAAELLTTGSDPIASIAVASGFYDQPSFTRTFARLTGETPAQYRRRARN